MDPLATSVLDFWFGAPGAPEYGMARDVWFRKDPDFDEEIRRAFGNAVETALAGDYVAWEATAPGALARVVLLDQFTRNIFRDTPRAFAGDALALAIAGRAVDAGFDRSLGPFERWFLYLPFEHAEDAGAQDRSLALFGALARETGQRGPLEWAEKHAAIIRRFGRYPHRNAVLGRASTAAEIAFLREPGSGF